MSDNPGLVDRVAGSATSLVISLVADVAAVVVLLANDNVVAWVASNPVAIVIALAALLAVTVTCVNGASRSRRVHRQLANRLQAAEAERDDLRTNRDHADTRVRQIEARNIVAVEQDRRRFAEFKSDFGKDTPLTNWLSNGFPTGMSHESYFDALDKLDHKWSKDPIEYNNKEVEASFQELKAALSKLDDVTVSHFFRIDGNPEYLKIETGIRLADDSIFVAAFREVEEAGYVVVERWRSFMQIAHKEQID